MNSCRRVRSLVSAYLEHEASPAERRFVDDHASRCRTCRETLAGVGALLTHLPRLRRHEADPDFTERVLARTHNLPAADLAEPVVRLLPPRRAAWAVPLAAAAAATLILAGIQLAGRGPGTGSPVAEVPAPRAGSPYALDGSPTLGPAAPVPRPEVLSYGEGEGQSLGMARDAYALGTYELRAATEGGTPVLTRVTADSEAPVTVTF